MRRWIAALVVIVVIVGAIIAIAAGGTKKETTPNPPTTNTQPTMTHPPENNQNPNTTATSTDKVSITNFKFAPDTITVKKGTKVTWTNNDSVGHTITADSGNGPNSDTIENGQTYNFTFDEVGTFNYHCSIHPSMHGTVTVTE